MNTDVARLDMGVVVVMCGLATGVDASDDRTCAWGENKEAEAEDDAGLMGGASGNTVRYCDEAAVSAESVRDSCTGGSLFWSDVCSDCVARMIALGAATLDSGLSFGGSVMGLTSCSTKVPAFAVGVLGHCSQFVVAEWFFLS